MNQEVRNDIKAERSGDAAERRRRVIGWILGGLAVLVLSLDAGAKLIAPQAMIDASPPLGLAPDQDLYRMLGAILAACVALHVWPRTALLGAVLLTGFLGGAVAVNVRADMPLFSNTLFGVYIGIVLWAGFCLRSPAVRSVMLHRPELR